MPTGPEDGLLPVAGIYYGYRPNFCPPTVKKLVIVNNLLRGIEYRRPHYNPQVGLASSKACILLAAITA